MRGIGVTQSRLIKIIVIAAIVIGLSSAFGILLNNYKMNKSRTINQVTIINKDMITTVSNGKVQLQYDRKSGLTTLDWGQDHKLSNLYSSYKAGDKLITSSSYSEHLQVNKIQTIQDEFGQGTIVSFENKSKGNPSILQHFTFYDGNPNLFIDVVILSATRISTAYISPLSVDSAAISMKSGKDNRVLLVPFDNDSWSRFQGVSADGNGMSYEVTAAYDNESRNGYVIGSLSHDIWKTGLKFKGNSTGIEQLEVYGGVADEHTRDTQPHAKIDGIRLASPQIFVGYYADWRDGMESYGHANAARNGVLKWDGGVPFGWNSWGTIQSNLDYETAVFHSDYIKEHLQNNQFNNQNEVYINLDSYWDNLSPQQLEEFVKHVHENGQKAGIYWAPFVYWGDDVSQIAEGGDYSFLDLIMKKSDGSLLPKLDGAFPLDPTHPGTQLRIDAFIDRFKKLGFEYIKLDFLTHASLEGKHYNPTIQTGMQAYNEGMRYVTERIGNQMFISQAISPIFPSQYAHARRISCDAFGVISGVKDSTEYMLNNLTYGWWQNGTIYSYTDPDHIKLTQDPMEAQSRVTSAVIAGTVYLDGDDLRNPVSQVIAEANLTNSAVNEIARKGSAFRPLEGNSGIDSGDTFTLHDEKNDYIAVFNFQTSESKSKTISLFRAGLKPDMAYSIVDLWSGRKFTATNLLTLNLAPKQSMLLKLTELTPNN
ncbi:alpha-galactosidase [Paenibacillus psychroresistens]|uniref:Alpha-galactosidase n=1 Tax=Paenibacillus psychroresistens TaxID=1778678 RepID=A0A6B8RH26_9BACL|nr:alpha-galactosidase [Paenibacillus psychroresistens]QGQ94688.1 alpha-galactosidase [Paenibacillus psychroresistens]